MLFKYDYVPADQLTNNNDLSIGRADFLINGWTDKDNNGQSMFTQAGDKRVDIILTVKDCTGNQKKYFDILTPKMNWKLKSLLDSIGMSDLYISSGTINLDAIVLKSGKCELRPSKNPAYSKPQIVYLTSEQAATPYTPPINAQQNNYSEQKANQSQMDEYEQIPF